jgi:membrane-associated phospholipid phosphatase
MYISDYISISVSLVYIIPLILYTFTGNWIHGKAFLGVTGTTVISETIKYFFIGTASPRPTGAKNCNMLCNDGNQAGQPGMPSSHSAEAAFFLGYYYQQTTNPFIRIALILYAVLIMISRYIKRCHTVNQIGAGALLGLSLSFIVVRHL